LIAVRHAELPRASRRRRHRLARAARRRDSPLAAVHRVAATVLFLFNIVAVVSYPDLPDIAVKDHILWGVMLLVLLVHGAGGISADHWLERGGRVG
jgi:hypothetical protein